ncbi:S-formylglutathione hydrolase [Oceanicella actignis]|uniref:S-formylglutathione hydrolase n=1 Tax=Oceanicella actignis TaxID=1189325 RepID=A0A1M7SUN7_9RHOB|nr:S-formylglutathione hydrolase [Oceanicella actignis]SES71846.1 S-formylglutathione hydrolase [Oceanicella actignis]SHN62277.1 S-formylglutathione hydrolase [Oceanicella actignis]
METLSESLCFGGVQRVLRHASAATGTDMTFSLYTPPRAGAGPTPCVIFLAGLTCTHENATVKAGFQRVAAELGLAVVCPDTSPRGEDAPDSPAYDLGQGAGFYVDATQPPWDRNFRMFTYVAEELPALLRDSFGLGALGLTGHSMGGHGALTIAMRRPETFESLSAFAPIVSPMNCPWGRKAFSAYLGEDRALWARHDACALVRELGWKGEILVDQGTADPFLEDQLKTALFEQACAEAGQRARIRMQAGYDHSYFFIATFIEDHLRHHAAALR